jgi:hypothetical protein
VSKGSRQRPLNRDKFRKNFDKINWGKSTWTNPKKRVPKKVHNILPDIEPYAATAGEEAKRGEYITSRSKEREYLRKNNCIQVGNEWDHFTKYGGKDHNNPTREWNK